MPADSTEKHAPGRAGRKTCGTLVPLVSETGMRRHICRFLGHKLPRRRRPFFFTERFQRCERCGMRVKLRGR
jgi:hypothetical protein